MSDIEKKQEECKHEHEQLVNPYANPLTFRCLDCGREVQVERRFPV